MSPSVDDAPGRTARNVRPATSRRSSAAHEWPRRRRRRRPGRTCASGAGERAARPAWLEEARKSIDEVRRPGRTRPTAGRSRTPDRPARALAHDAVLARRPCCAGNGSGRAAASALQGAHVQVASHADGAQARDAPSAAARCARARIRRCRAEAALVQDPDQVDDDVAVRELAVERGLVVHVGARRARSVGSTQRARGAARDRGVSTLTS